MGCIGSRLVLLRNRTLEGRTNSHSGPNVFAVLNVDDMSRHISPGKLEVTETDLVLHLRGKPPLTWPLRCLRRYGYEEDLFSFESGRRCPTGAGIYAFKCNRAQSLFNLLQSKIQGSNPANVPVPSTPITPNLENMNNMSPTFDYVNITENSLARSSTDDLEARTFPHGTSSSKVCHPVPEGFDEGNHPVYMNIDGHGANAVSASKSTHIANDVSNQTIMNFPGVHKPMNNWGANKNLSNFSSQSVSAVGVNSSVVYTNVDCSAGTPKKVPEINYAELDLQTDHLRNVSNIYSNFSSTKTKHLTFVTGAESSKAQKMDSQLKNYETSESRNIVASTSRFNEDNRKPNTSPKHSNSASNHSELGYATIDFDRTAALSIVTRSKIKLDFSCSSVEPPVSVPPPKKNRHNSTAL